MLLKVSRSCSKLFVIQAICLLPLLLQATNVAAETGNDFEEVALSRSKDDAAEKVNQMWLDFVEYFSDENTHEILEHIWYEFGLVMKSRRAGYVIRTVVDEIHLTLSDSSAHTALLNVKQFAQTVLNKPDGLKFVTSVVGGLHRLSTSGSLKSLSIITDGLSKSFQDEHKRQTVLELFSGLLHMIRQHSKNEL